MLIRFVVALSSGWLGAAPLVPERFPVTAGSRALVIPYQRSHPLDGIHPQVERVVVALHSSNYRAQDAYNAVIIAAGGHSGESDTVCILAPQFLESDEIPSGTNLDNLLYWNSFPFRGTSNARYGPSAERVSISIFDVLDQILARVTDTRLFPHLKTIVIVGHSAGGQAVNRYAVAGRFPETLGPDRKLHFRYLVLAPSSYLYFSPERDADGDGVFTIPGSCATYDDWGYGLQDLWTYPAATGETVMRAQYPRRFVFYLVGEDDDDPNDPTLATDCAARQQGPHRVARAQTYFQHLLGVFGEELRQFQSLHLVPGVGHSYTGQLNSALGRRFLLDAEGSDEDGDGQTDWAEWIAGTDPRDPSDRFTLFWEPEVGPGSLGLAWKALPGRRYAVWRSADLGMDWEEVDAIRQADAAGPARWEVSDPPREAFYRVQVELE